MLGFSILIVFLTFVLGKKLKKQTTETPSSDNQKRKKMAFIRTLMLFGVVLSLISGGVMIYGYVTQASQEKQQVQLFQLESNKIVMTNGSAKAKLRVHKNTKITIKHEQNKVDPVKSKATDKDRELSLVFVMPGKYEVLGENGGTQQKQTLIVEKEKTTKKSSVSSSSSDQQDAPATIIEEPIEKLDDVTPDSSVADDVLPQTTPPVSNWTAPESQTVVPETSPIENKPSDVTEKEPTPNTTDKPESNNVQQENVNPEPEDTSNDVVDNSATDAVSESSN